MLARLWLAAKIYLFWVAFFLLARVLFLLYHRDQTASLAAAAITRVFEAGLRLDLSAAAYLSLVPFVLLAVSGYRRLAPIVRRLLQAWFALSLLAMTLLLVSDFEIAARWGRRIDAAVIPFLATPREAWASAGASPRFLLLVGVVVWAAVALWVVRALIGRPLARAGPAHWLNPLPLLLAIGGLVVAGRGGVQTWPLTVSSAYHSSVPFANLAAQNAAWGFFDSMYRRAYDTSNPYRIVADSTARHTIEAAHRPVGPPRQPPIAGKTPNVLLIIWESASARAFGSLGGVEGVTPRFDSLRREGLLFRRFYAAGDRTDKGIAATLSGFPGIPNSSILKVASKTRALPFLTAQFRAAGYRTGFYYGGELEFASLQAYLTSAGFDTTAGKGDFPPEQWNSQWGAHDGVVADRLLADIDRGREPFFNVWLTLSSHEPFEAPTHPTIPGNDWQSRYFNALAYTDRVLGELIGRAKEHPWWRNTLVIIVADHGRRVLPLDSATPPLAPDIEYRVPMLWLGGALTTRDSVVDEIASQLDVAPTLTDLLGLDPKVFRYGRSLLHPVATPLAYYGYDVGFGLVTERGQLVFDHRAGRISWQTGAPSEEDRRLGHALLQESYQDYLNR